MHLYITMHPTLMSFPAGVGDPMKSLHGQPDPEGRDPGHSQVCVLVLGPVLQHLDVLFDQSLLKASTSPESTWPWVTPAGALNLNNSTERIAGTHKPFHHVQGHWSFLLQIMHHSSPWMESGRVLLGGGPGVVKYCCGDIYLYTSLPGGTSWSTRSSYINYFWW